MLLAYINPNSTVAMTESVVSVARSVMPGTRMIGLTNADGPPAIQGAKDGAAAIPGLLTLVPEAVDKGADAIVIACFDDTGLDAARSVAPCPVLGIGQSAYVMADLLGKRFSVVTSLPVAVPIIRNNIIGSGFGGNCVSVRASGLPVLAIEEGGKAALSRLSSEIRQAQDEDGAETVVLGCAGMAKLRHDLAAHTGVQLIDGVVAATHLANATARFARQPQ